MSQDIQNKFAVMCEEGKFSTGLKDLQRLMTLIKQAEIKYSIYEVIASRCENIIYKIINDTSEAEKITRSDLEDFNEKAQKLANIIQEIREREKISKILEPRKDYSLFKQMQWELDVLDKNLKISSKEQNYKQSLEELEQQCQRMKQLDEFQQKLLQQLAFLNKDQNKITKEIQILDQEKMVLSKLGELYKHKGEQVIEFYRTRKPGIIYELREKYIEEVQNTEEQNNNFQMIFPKQNVLVSSQESEEIQLKQKLLQENQQLKNENYNLTQQILKLESANIQTTEELNKLKKLIDEQNQKIASLSERQKEEEHSQIQEEQEEGINISQYKTITQESKSNQSQQNFILQIQQTNQVQLPKVEEEIKENQSQSQPIQGEIQ